MSGGLDAQGIAELFARQGHLAYDGEYITQWMHAWQCGQLARQAGASPALQLAAWLHDVGHLLTGLEDTPTLRGHDDRHEALAAQALRPLFGAAVAEPVALHVEAKRYLVSSSPGYRERLSPDSVRSLALQGGAMNEEDCAAFLRMPYAADAMRLRAWDDVGKDPARQPGTDALAELIALMSSIGPGTMTWAIRPRGVGERGGHNPRPSATTLLARGDHGSPTCRLQATSELDPMSAVSVAEHPIWVDARLLRSAAAIARPGLPPRSETMRDSDLTVPASRHWRRVVGADQIPPTSCRTRREVLDPIELNQRPRTSRCCVAALTHAGDTVIA